MAVDELCDLARHGMEAVLSRYPGSVVVHGADADPDVGSGVDLVLHHAEAGRDPGDQDTHPAARRVSCGWGPGAGADEQSLSLDLSLPADQVVARLLALRWRVASTPTGTPTGTSPAALVAAPTTGAALVGRAGLGPREAQVLGLIGQGLSNAEIAGLLSVTINTLKTYIRTGYRKIGVSSRTQATLWVVAARSADRRDGGSR